jgi:hypothetical protein
MSSIRRILGQIVTLFRKEELDRDLDAELAAHVELAVEDNLERGMPLFRLVEHHLEEFLRAYPERFAKTHGPLRPVVERGLRGFMRCGLVEHGFARLWCPRYRTSVLCPFSCRGRNFCPSCEKKKKKLLWAEWLHNEVLAPVRHRHLVLTCPASCAGSSESAVSFFSTSHRVPPRP